MAQSTAEQAGSGSHTASAVLRWLLTPWSAVLLGVVVYANSLGGGFTYDDVPIIEQNPRIRSLANIREIWLKDWWGDPTAENPLLDPSRDRLYRPLTLYTFALNYALHGLHPVGYHAANIALHALASGLVFVFARRWLGSARVAAAAALLFAVHPVHAEAVAGVVGRAEVLAALLILAGLIALLPLARVSHVAVPVAASPLRTAGAALLFLLALLAKETAICYAPVALIVLGSIHRGRHGWGWWALRGAILLAPLAAYFPLRFVALESRMVRDRLVSGLFNPLNEAPLSERLVGPFTIFGHYVRLTFAPADLCSDYGLAIVNPPAGPDGMTALGLAGAVAIGYLLARPSMARRAIRINAHDSATDSPVGWGARPAIPLAWLTAIFLVSYVLISNTVLLIGVSLAERLFYWPSVPVLIGLALAAVKFWERVANAPDAARRARAPLLLAIGALLLLALGARAAVRSSDWASNETLFPIDATAHPQAAHLNCIFGQLRVNQAAHAEDPQTAAALAADAYTALQRALNVAPRFPQALTAMGQLHMLRDEPDAARDCFERALALQPGNALAAAGLARLRGSDQTALARENTLRDALSVNPQDVGKRIELGRALIALGKNFDALREFQTAEQQAPQNIEVLRGLADTLILNLQREDAAGVLKRLVAIAPDDWQAHANLTTLLRDTDAKATLLHARRAMELHPEDLRVQVNLAEAIALNGDKDDALRRLRAIERGLPADSSWKPIIADRIHDLATRGP